MGNLLISQMYAPFEGKVLFYIVASEVPEFTSQCCHTKLHVV
jgi:hypothetical protein